VHKPRSVADLLHSSSPRLAHLATRARAAVTLREEVQSLLPPRLQPHLAQASERLGELTLWVDSGAYCARLRFEIPNLRASVSAKLGRPVQRIRVRVQPRSAQERAAAAASGGDDSR
jgi:hypothetical protein